MEWNGEHSALLSAVASAVTAVIAVLALIVAGLQILKANETQREATAQDTFREYLKLAIEEPSFASGQAECADACKDPEESYSWFVSYFLHSAEHIFLVYPTDTGWCKALAYQFCLHRRYLSGDEFQHVLSTHYNESFLELTNRSIRACPDNAPLKEAFGFCNAL